MNPTPTLVRASFPTGPDASISIASNVAHVPERELQWRTRYDGIVAIAYVGDKAVAGISGPWSGKFALTWWERPLPARQLELYDSQDDAKREVEAWALRMRTGYPAQLPGITAPESTAPAKVGLLGQVRALLPDIGRRRGRDARESIERVRQMHASNEADVCNLHFAAYE